MLNITHYQRNANQNHNEVPFHASQNECFYLFIFFSVTALFYLEDSRRIHPRSVRACQPKDLKRREWRRACWWGAGRGVERERERGRQKSARTRERESKRKRFGSSFYVFFFHLGLPYANWA